MGTLGLAVILCFRLSALVRGFIEWHTRSRTVEPSNGGNAEQKNIISTFLYLYLVLMGFYQTP